MVTRPNKILNHTAIERHAGLSRAASSRSTARKADHAESGQQV